MSKQNEIVRMIIGSKVWEISRRMVNSTIELAKQKYRKENVNAIVAVEKDNIIAMQKDVFNDTDAFVEAVTKWERGGYKCYYTTKKEKR